MDCPPRRRNGSGRGPRPARRAPLRWAARSQRPAAWLWVSLHLHLTAQRLQDKPSPAHDTQGNLYPRASLALSPVPSLSLCPPRLQALIGWPRASPWTQSALLHLPLLLLLLLPPVWGQWRPCLSVPPDQGPSGRQKMQAPHLTSQPTES